MAMPKRMGAEMRELVMVEDRSQLQLERSVWNNTGFVNVIQVGNKYQARLQVPGDGRGGAKKRRQHSLPGLFDTAEDAAVMLAVIKRGFRNEAEGEIHSPPKQNKQHKPRSRSNPKKPLPAVQRLQPTLELVPQQEAQMQTPMATTMAVPVPFFVHHAPVVAATPLPMQPLCYAPLL